MTRPAGLAIALIATLAACGAPQQRTEPVDDDPVPRVQTSDPLATPGCEARADGTMTREAVQICIHAQLVSVRACYIQALIRDRSLRGKVAVTLAVAPEGTIAEASARTTGFEDPVFDACVAQRAQRWRFPARPAASALLRVTYPVHLTAE